MRLVQSRWKDVSAYYRILKQSWRKLLNTIAHCWLRYYKTWIIYGSLITRMGNLAFLVPGNSLKWRRHSDPHNDVKSFHGLMALIRVDGISKKQDILIITEYVKTMGWSLLPLTWTERLWSRIKATLIINQKKLRSYSFKHQRFGLDHPKLRILLDAYLSLVNQPMSWEYRREFQRLSYRVS